MCLVRQKPRLFAPDRQIGRVLTLVQYCYYFQSAEKTNLCGQG